MHDGCTGSLSSGQQVVDKLRMMGFNAALMPEVLSLCCHHCGEAMMMTTFEFSCEKCGAVHGVTPCHASNATHVQCAGPDY